MGRTSPARIADLLRAQILAGSLAGGVQLKQEQLAQTFGVSRIPVREALTRLAAEGLVVLEPNKGATVFRPSLAEIVEALDIRLALETRALALALPRMTPATLARSEQILARYDKATTPAQWTRFNLEFHLSLYEPAGRPRFLSMIETVVTGIDRHVRERISLALGRDDPQADHYAILDACRRGDVEQAVARLHRHIEGTQRALIAGTAA
jgi:DNA-binding GntR family transcriptional regulator